VQRSIEGRVMSRRVLLASLVLALAPGPGAAQSTEELYQAACDAGDLFVCNLFGIMYESGDGIEQNPERAAELYGRACEGGELRGCTNLASMYEEGSGIAVDIPHALGLYRVACEGGEQLGCDRLADFGPTAEFVTGATFSRSGRIGEAETGRPLPEAVIEVGGSSVRAISDEEGRFELTGLPPGRHFVQATRLGYDPAIGEIDVPATSEFVFLLTPAVGDTRAPGRVEGRVVDSADRGLPGVEIIVPEEEGLRTITNQQGRFTLRDVDPGLTEVRFAHLGYAPRTAAVVVQPGRTVELLTTLVEQPIELEAIQVTVRSRYLEQNGFYNRRDVGRGVHFTPYDIERIDPIEISDLLRERVPGIRIQYGQGGEARVVSRRSITPTLGPCVLPVYIDGVRAFDQDLDRYPPEQIEAMEIYPGIGTPIEFIAHSNPCGLVLLWTRRGA
jgi:hypothetical protein